MEFLVKGAVIGIIATVIALMIKNKNPEMALILSIAAGIVILFFALNMFAGLKDFIENLADTAGISSAILSPVIKSIGIAIAGRIASDICKDANYSATASAIELIASTAAIYVSIPLMKTVLQMLQSFM